MAKTIVVKQVGSPIRRPEIQRKTLIGLGLNKMHKTRELEDTPSVRGMINKIPHLVEIVEEKGEALRVFTTLRARWGETPPYGIGTPVRDGRGVFVLRC